MEKIDKYLVENEIQITLQILENQYDTKNKVINLKNQLNLIISIDP